ncbi:GntR family transcriptional regulator [Blastococcus brunescens]|uniref:GntR family transcriptional regulator n=1 Tax=Blastococcus brunescens TaxID=1564165 RepID=A0ABZ1B3J8_9ACTN|nr:GntR family transcriptional regulator [Blastococcus sp. BMG 8361]WRL63625.1 GntR family transcriptional regulator [Blastococcus sp. BMG 8361]
MSEPRLISHPRKAAVARRASPYERLKQAIMSGELLPGEQLIEIALAKWCQVSRTPIREALTRLEQDGLARRTERGLVVRESSPGEIMDIYEARIVLESKVAAVAAERHTAADLMAMRRADDRFAAVDLQDAEALAERNRDFHRAIWAASHNAALVDLLERLDMHLGRYPLTTLAFPGRHQAALEEHVALVSAISDRDAEAAAQIAMQHFTAARDIRLQLWQEE